MSPNLLEQSIQTGNLSEIDRLLKSDPSLVHEVTSQGVSPLMLSCYFKKPQVSKLLLDYVIEVSFFEAAALGILETVALHLDETPTLINSFSVDGFTALGLSAYFGQEEVVRYLLRYHADPNLPSRNGFAVYPIHSATAANQEMITKMLVEAGAEVNVQQVNGVTPLHSAAHNGNIGLLIVLLEAGAEVKAQMEDGRTPADMAADRGFTEIASILSD